MIYTVLMFMPVEAANDEEALDKVLTMYRDGAVMRVHAYFRSEEEAANFLGALDCLLAPTR